MTVLRRLASMVLAACLLAVWAAGCGSGSRGEEVELEVPRGYMAILTVEQEGRVYGFGPFVGYYFRPEDPHDLSRLRFVCLNEGGFYSAESAKNERLFEGEAILVSLPDIGVKPPSGSERIQPVFFEDAPAEWLETRPEPQNEFVHFHSCYDARGPVLRGYWLRHKGVVDFTYDMGGRVGPDSPLYHEVRKEVDRDFARIVEFDSGPGER
jgi:hypothetical protein